MVPMAGIPHHPRPMPLEDLLYRSRRHFMDGVDGGRSAASGGFSPVNAHTLGEKRHATLDSYKNWSRAKLGTLF